ncbi:hypothetical protein [Sedimenticola sp.]|uniref:hypothetical protein n=1 Tax=Sedimenticola sp. TaxID=1940285 RepID=UPI003D13E615
MKYPPFFDLIGPVQLRDPLAEVLGAMEGGVMQIGYLDVVRLAGHSCPTVAGAFLMARKGLAALYGDALPVRGEIAVKLQQPIGEGVTGVIANVLSLYHWSDRPGWVSWACRPLRPTKFIEF